MSYDAIPAELRDLRAWVVWRWEPDPAKLDKPRKPPYRANDPTSYAKVDDPRSWGTFDRAAGVVAAGDADGIGFALAPPYVGVDLDDELSASERYAAMLALDSYSEVSPSGEGHHVIVRATLPAKGYHPKGIGVFQRERFFYCTGQHVDGMRDTIEDRQTELDALLAEYVPDAHRNGYEPAETIKPVRPVSAPAHLLARLSETPGDRSTQSFTFVRDCIRSGLPDEATMALALEHEPTRQKYGQRAAGEIERSIRKIRAEALSPNTDEANSRTLRATPLSEITMRSIEWLEKPLWQRSAFQLLAGAKGAGKGTYLAGLAARISRNANVLFVSTEDSAEIDLKPRLVAAGYVEERCFVIRQHVRLPDHIDELRSLAKSVGGVGLYVVDPVANHIGNRNSNSEAEVRDAIAPLNRLADELDCLLIGVRHVGKDRSRGAVASILGSTAWVDTPRAVVMIAKDDEDPLLRHIQVIAGNRSLNGSAQAFRIEAVDVPGLKEPITQAVELGASSKSVEDLLTKQTAGQSRTQEAREALLDILEADGEQESDSLDARVARETGLAVRSVRNLRTKLVNEGFIKSHPDKDETGQILRWVVSRTQALRDDGALEK